MDRGKRLKEGRAQSLGFHMKHLTRWFLQVGPVETNQCEQLTWPRVEANEIFVKSFFFKKMDPSEKNIENTEVKGFISPITTNQNLQTMQCCSGIGLLPPGRTLKEGHELCEELCGIAGEMSPG